MMDGVENLFFAAAPQGSCQKLFRAIAGDTVNDHFRRKEGKAVCDKVAVFLQRKKWKRVIFVECSKIGAL